MTESDKTTHNKQAAPGADVRRLEGRFKQRLHGRRIPVWSYLKRKSEKRINKIRTRWRERRRPDSISIGGIRLDVDRMYLSDKIIRRLYDGGYEREERIALERTLHRDDRVLELGTGIGYLSAVAAKRVGSEQVVTVEANSALRPIIESMHRLNGVKPELMFGLMSDSPDRRPRAFYTHTQHLWSSSLHQPADNYRRVDVTVLPWSDELNRLRPTYLVMDIEGGEIELLRDFHHHSVRRMLVEFHPRKSDAGAIDEVFEHLSRIGFGVDRVSSGANVFYFERQI